MLLMDERSWAKAMLETNTLGKKPSFTLAKIARMYYEDGYKKKEIRGLLDDFMIRCDRRIILSRWDKVLDGIVKNVQKIRLVFVENIVITEDEIARLKNIKEKQDRKIAFTLLCLAKYFNQIRQTNNFWVNTEDKDIMRMANVHTSLVRQSAILKRLRDAGYIRFSNRVDNLDMQICFANDESDKAVEITDLRNLGNQYLMFCGEKYFKCSNCGLTVKKTSNARKYCQDCASEIRVRKAVDDVTRGTGFGF